MNAPDKHGWRPIENAPKDEHILVARGKIRAVVFWDSDWQEWIFVAGGMSTFRGVTHWQPLPPPPESEQ